MPVQGGIGAQPNQNSYSEQPSIQNNFNYYKNLINQMGNSGSVSTRESYGLNEGNQPFSLSGGTFDRYNGNYNPIDTNNVTDNFFAEAHRIGEFWNNLPANITGDDNWRFDPTKLSEDPLGTVGKFAASLPGMIVGGIPTGVADLGEAITGNPYHEIVQKEDGKWYMPDYKLDASQQAASFGNSIINTFGTFAGGSGRVIGALGTAGRVGAKSVMKAAMKEATGQAAAGTTEKALTRAQRFAKTSRAFEDMGKGVFTRMAEQEGIKHPQAAGWLADIGDEAVEEFTQGYLDDVRNKNVDEGTFGRMLTGAAWGAAGGGIMGGVGRLGSYGLSKLDPRQEDQQADRNEPHTERDSIWAQAKSWRNFTLNPEAKRELDEFYRTARNAPGAGIFKHTGSSDELDVDQANLGDENIKQIYMESRRSAEKIAHAFGSTTEEMDNIFNSVDEEGNPVAVYNGNTYNNIADALNALMIDKGNVGHVQIALGRNPDTKNGGFMLDIANIKHGQCLELHPMAYAITGSDIDGDTSAIYFDPRSEAGGDASKDLKLNVNGYASELLYDPEGSSNVDWWYAGIDEYVKAAKENGVRDLFASIFEPFTDSDELTSQYTNNFFSIVNLDSDTRNVELSKLFTELAADVQTRRDAGSVKQGFDPNRIPNGRSAVNMAIKEISRDNRIMVRKYILHTSQNFMQNVLGVNGYNMETAERFLEEFEKTGSLGDNTKVAQLTNNLGLLAYVISDKGNPIYRQYGQMYYWAKSKSLEFKNLTETMAQQTSTDSVFTNLLRSSFRLVQAGENPTDAIEGLIDDLTLNETMALYAKKHNTGAPKTVEQVNDFKEIFVEVQSRYAKLYNESCKAITQDDEENLPGFTARDLLSEVRTKNPDAFESKFWQQYYRIFGDMLASDLIDIKNLPEQYQYMTLRQLVEYIARTKSMHSLPNVIAALNEGEGRPIYNILDNLTHYYNGELKGIRARISTIFEGLNTEGIWQRIQDNNGHVAAYDLSSVLALMDAVQNVIGVESALRMNFVYSEDFLNSRFGEMLLNAKNMDDIINLCTSVSLRAQFDFIIQDINSDDDAIVNNARIRLAELSHISPVHAQIAAEILETKQSKTFEYLTDPYVDLSTKEADFNQLIGIQYSAEDYVVSALRNQTGEFDLSSVSSRLRKAEVGTKKFKRIVREKVLGEANSFINDQSFINASDQEIMDFISYISNNITVQPNADLLWMKIYASLTNDNKYVEKAVNTNAASLMFLHNQIGENGNLVSHFDSITGHQVGHISKSDWLGNRYHVLSCLTDPNYRQEVYDEDTRTVVIMTQENFIRTVEPRFNSGDPINKSILTKLLIGDESHPGYPQLCGYLVDGAVQDGVMNGVPGVQPARGNELLEQFNKFLKERNDPAGSEIERAIHRTQCEMYNTPVFQDLVTLMLPRDVLAGSIDMRRGSMEVRRAMDKAARFIYIQAARYHNGEEDGSSYKKAKTFFETNSSNRLLDRIWTLATEAVNETSINAGGGILSSAESMMNSGIYGTLGNMRISSILADQGWDVSNISVAGSMGVPDNIVKTYGENIQRIIKDTLALGEIIAFVKAGNTINEFDAIYGNISIFEMAQDLIANPENVKKLSNGKKLTQEQLLEKAQEVIRNAYETSENMEAQIKDIADVVLDAKDFDTEASLIAKLQKLYEGENQYDNIAGDVKSVFKYYDSSKSMSEQSSAFYAARDALITVTNRNIIAFRLRDISRLECVPLDENALQHELEFHEAFHDTVADFSKKFHQNGSGIFKSDLSTVEKYYVDAGWGNDLNGLNIIQNLDFLDRTKRASLSNQQIMNMAAGNSVLVGTNGSMGKKVAAFGHLPSEIRQEDSYVDESYTAGDLLYNISPDFEIQNWWALDGNGELTTVGSQNFRQYLRTLPPDQNVPIYNPFDNVHGLAVANTPAPSGKQNKVYHRLSGIIARIIQAEQEAMVMKLKKKFKAVDRIVIGRDRKNSSNSINLPVFDPNGDQDFEFVRGMFTDFRREYANTIGKEFQKGGSLDMLGFDREQALLLAQALTPGVRVNLTVTTTVTDEQGNTRQETRNVVEVIDAHCFFGQDAQQKFASRFGDIYAKYPDSDIKINDFNVLTVTVSECNNRIYDAVSSAAAANGHALTKQQSEDAAYNAMNDWSDYGSHYSDDARIIMDHLPPVGFTYPSRWAAADSPTSYQNLYGERFYNGSNVDHSIDSKKRQYIADPTKPEAWPDRKQYNAWYAMYSTTGHSFCKIFGSEEDIYNVYNISRSTNSNLRDYIRDFQAAFDEKSDVVPAGSSILCLGIDHFNDALEAAKRHNLSIYLPSSISIGTELLGGSSIKPDRVNIRGKEFTVITPQLSNRWDALEGARPQSSKLFRNRNFIHATFVAASGDDILGDAQIRIAPNIYDQSFSTTGRKKYSRSFMMGDTAGKNNMPLSLMSRVNAQNLLNQVADHENGRYVPKDDNSAWEQFDFNTDATQLGKVGGNENDNRDIRVKVVQYLADLAHNKDMDPSDPRPTHPRRNQVGALLTDGTRYVPVVYPDMPLENTYADIRILASGDIEISWSGKTPLHSDEENSSVKLTISGETFKGMASAWLDDVDVPKLAGGREINMAISEDSEGSRVHGRESKLLSNALHYRSILEDGSLFFKHGKGSKSNQLSDHIEQTWPQWAKDELTGTRTRNLTDQIISGKLTITGTDVDPIIQEMIRVCDKHDVDWLSMFSAYRLEKARNSDGTFKTDADGNYIYNRVSTGAANDPDYYSEVDYDIVHHYFRDDDLLRVYNKMDTILGENIKLCPNGKHDTSEGFIYAIDNQGRSAIFLSKQVPGMVHPTTGEQITSNNVFQYRTVRYGFNQVLGDSTLEHTPGGEAAISRQHEQMRAMDNGYLDGEIMRALEYEDYTNGNYDRALDVYQNTKREREQRIINNSHSQFSQLQSAFEYNIKSAKEAERLARAMTLLDITFRTPRKYIDRSKKDSDGNPKVLSRKEVAVEVRSALKYFRDKTGLDLSFEQIEQLTLMHDGSSYNEKNPEDWKISYQSLDEDIRAVADNLSDPTRPMPVKCLSEDSSRIDGRYSIAMITREIVDWTWESEIVQHAYESKEEYIAEIKKEMNKSENAIKSISNSDTKNLPRKRALSMMCFAARQEWGDASTIGPFYEDIDLPTVGTQQNQLAEYINSEWTEEQKALFRECCKMSDEKFEQLKIGMEKSGYKLLKNYGENKDAYNRVSDARQIVNLFNNLADCSKMMALLNPILGGANILDRGFHSGMMDISTRLAAGKGRLVPYSTKHQLKEKIIDMAVNDPIAIKLWNSYRMMEFNGDEIAFLMGSMQNANMQALSDWIDTRNENLKNNWFENIKDKIFRYSSGGSTSSKKQMKNFIRRFVAFAEANGEDFWFKESQTRTVPDGFFGDEERPMLFLEEKLESENGFAEFFVETLLSRKQNPSFSSAMKAMNSSKQGDLAQRHALQLALQELFRRIPGGMGNFLMTTCVSRFPGYSINLTERVLNYVMPMSTIRYVMTEKLGRTQFGQEIGVEETQIHTSLREAILIDAMKLGLFNLALIGMALGAAQPPDDEKRWGNVEEWGFFGCLPGEIPWWMQDICGIALPLMAFWKSMELGKPRPDIIMNGVMDVCYSNPLLRAGDMLVYIADPYNGVLSDFNDDLKNYQKAKGGAPDFDRWISANIFNACMGWASQFVLPSIVRDWARNSPLEEKSYKTIYKDASHTDVEYTTYEDAMRRKLTRRNPVLGLLFNLTNDTTTSYLGWEMPDTIYYDEAQIEAMESLSIAGLQGEERMAKINMIINDLASVDNIEELAATGYFLDGETLSAVASQVWDNYHAVDEWYYNLQSEGKLDYYTAGGGDWATGQQIVGQIKLDRDNMKQYWYNFYYDKLYKQPISGSMQKYTRINTRYAKDVYGNYYATGYTHSPLLGLPTRESDFLDNGGATISEVTRKPMYDENGEPIRGLVPVDGEFTEMPDFKAWSGDGSGETYSKQYQNMYGKTGDISGQNTSFKSTSSRNYGGGGGGYRRSGGGGGGRSYGTPQKSGTPAFNAPYISASKPSRIMNASDRIEEADTVSYLRPDFETKGSREAYKRSDI